MSKRSRGWTFTLNNWTEEDVGELMALWEECHSLTYMIVGFEKGTREQTPHIQGYMYFRDPKPVSFMKKINGFRFQRRLHIEPQKSKSNVAAYEYCMEEGDYKEFGERPRQGHRTDLEVIKHDLLQKKSMRQISTEYFSQWCQYRRSFDEFQRMHDLYDRQDTTIMVYNEETIKKVYTYNLAGSFVYEDGYYNKSELLHKYYSGLYKYIFVPNTPGVEELGDKFNIEVIY